MEAMLDTPLKTRNRPYEKGRSTPLRPDVFLETPMLADARGMNDNDSRENGILIRVPRSMKSKNKDSGKPRIGDDWNAIRIIAMSRSPGAVEANESIG
jgi:hypothetical protein